MMVYGGFFEKGASNNWSQNQGSFTTYVILARVSNTQVGNTSTSNV